MEGKDFRRPVEANEKIKKKNRKAVVIAHHLVGTGVCAHICVCIFAGGCRYAYMHVCTCTPKAQEETFVCVPCAPVSGCMFCVSIAICVYVCLTA